MRDRHPEIRMDEATRQRALLPVQRMLEMSKNLSPVKQSGD
jgi:quinolinate synthase